MSDHSQKKKNSPFAKCPGLSLQPVSVLFVLQGPASVRSLVISAPASSGNSHLFLQFPCCISQSLKILISIECLNQYSLEIHLDKRQVIWNTNLFSSVQLLSHVRLFATYELQHARPHCPSPTPRVHSNSCPLSRWCHPVISSSVIPFSSCPQSLPASESFPMSQLFESGGQSIGVSALASALPMNTQDWCPLERTGWISL